MGYPDGCDCAGKQQILRDASVLGGYELESSVMYEEQARKAMKTDPLVALVAATEAVAIAPQGIDAHLERGNALSALGRKSEAVEEYRKVKVIAEGMEAGTRETWEGKMDGLIAKNSE